MDAPFVADWRAISESGVASCRIVPALDEGEDGHAGFGLGLELPSVKELAFERGEEALTHGIVVGVANGSH